MKKPTPMQKRVAYHEAGHAVISVCLRRSLKKASIIRDEDSEGRVFRELSPWILQMMAEEQIRAYLLEKEIQTLLAGNVAEERFTGRHASRGSEGDRRVCVRLASKLHTSNKVIEKYIDYQMEIVREMISSPVTWVQIEAVAENLLEFRELDGKRIRQICREAMNSRHDRLEELRQQRKEEDKREQEEARRRYRNSSGKSGVFSIVTGSNQ